MKTTLPIAELLIAVDPAELRHALAEFLAQDGDWGELAEQVRALALRDVDRAERVSAELLALAETYGPRVQRQIAVARAHVLSYANRFDEALELLDTAAEKARTEGARAEFAQLRLTAVQPLARAGRLSEAATAAEEAVVAFEQADDAERTAMARVNLGIVLRMQDRPRAALDCFAAARPQLAGNMGHLAVLGNNEAEALLDLDEFDAAACAFEEAADAFEGAGNRHAAAIVAGNLAHLLSRQGHWDAALAHFERAYRHFEQCGAAGDAARLDAERAQTLADAGALSESEHLFAGAIARLDAVGLPREAALARIGQGVVLARQGRTTAAEAALLDAARRSTALGQAAWVGEIHIVLAEIAQQQADWERAERLLRQARTVLADRPARRARINCALTRTCTMLRKWDAARDYLHEADAAAAELPLPPLVVDTEHARARLLHATGLNLAASAAATRAVQALERIRGALRAERLRSATVRAGQEVYHDCWKLAFDRGDADGLGLGFDALERMRARGLLELMGGFESAAPVLLEASDPARRPVATPPAADDDERRLLAALYRARGRLRVHYEQVGLTPEDRRTPTQRSARTPLVDLEMELQAIEARLAATRRLAPAFRAPLTLSAARALLPAGCAAVKYFVEDQHYSAMIVRRDGVALRRAIAPIVAVSAAIRRAEFQIERQLVRGIDYRPALRGAYDAAARDLAAHLIEPLATDFADCPRLLVAPYGELHNVPWHALPLGGAPLLCAHEVTYIPSLSSAAALQERAAQTPGRGCGLLAVGLRDEIAGHTEDEARAIAAGHANAVLLLGDAATPPEFAKHAANAAHLHVATHCVYAPHAPLSSRLRLAGGWLTVRDIAELRLPGSVVTLAACESGRHAADTGEERHGLIRAFLIAGAGAVLGSLWRLHDATALELFRGFYQGQVSSPGTRRAVESLRRVQLDVYHRGWPPAYWSGLFVAGGLP